MCHFLLAFLLDLGERSGFFSFSALYPPRAPHSPVSDIVLIDMETYSLVVFTLMPPHGEVVERLRGVL
jgi:hypothetical protein